VCRTGNGFAGAQTVIGCATLHFSVIWQLAGMRAPMVGWRPGQPSAQRKSTRLRPDRQAPCL